MGVPVVCEMSNMLALTALQSMFFYVCVSSLCYHRYANPHKNLPKPHASKDFQEHCFISSEVEQSLC